MWLTWTHLKQYTESMQPVGFVDNNTSLRANNICIIYNTMSVFSTLDCIITSDVPVSESADVGSLHDVLFPITVSLIEVNWMNPFCAIPGVQTPMVARIK